MSFKRYKRFGKQEYAYEITSYWDKNKNAPRQKSKYLGVVIDKKMELYEKRRIDLKKEKLILDFGDVYLIYEFLKNVKVFPLIEKVFSDKSNYLLTLICYRLCYPSAMMYSQTWYEGNIARFLLKGVDISSQRISEFLVSIGDEELHREFFRNYIPTFTKTKNGVIIDTTALPNQIHFPFNAWGYHDEIIDKQIRSLLVIDNDSSFPLFFRYLPGNIVDVSSLKFTIEELKKYGIKNCFVLIDGGFFSEDNIKELYWEKMLFLTRLPSSRKLYKKLIREECMGLEKFGNAVRYGKRVLFVKQKTVSLFGKKVYAHMILDPERKGREIKKFLLETLDEQIAEENEEINYKLMKKGVMILVSSFKIEKEEVVPLYYIRQTAEKLFGFSKDDLKLIPLRVHTEDSLRGYLLLSFITLLVFVFLKKEIGADYTVEEILLTLRNLKCKVYDDEILIQEPTKRQKEILEKLKIIVPKRMGI
ncbi:MAG: transposase [Candidatus Thermoplasmatota archaeon]